MCVDRICPRLLRSSAGLSPVPDLLSICSSRNAHRSNAHAMTTDVSTVFAFCCVQGFQDIRPRTSDGGESFYSLSVAVRMRYTFRRSNPCDARGSHGLAPHKPLVVSRTSGRSAGGYRSASARPSRVFFATVGRILAWSARAVTRSSRSARVFCLAPSSGMLQMGLWRRMGPMGLSRRSVLPCRARSLHVASTCAGMPDARRRRLAATLSEPGRAMSSRRHVHPDMCEGALHAYVHGSISCFERRSAEIKKMMDRKEEGRKVKQ